MYKKIVTSLVGTVISGGILLLLLDLLIGVGCNTVTAAPLTLIAVALDLLCALLMSAVFLSIAGERQDRLFMRLYVWMLAVTIVALLGDAMSRRVNLPHLQVPSILGDVGSFLAYASAYPLIVLFSIYLLSYVNEERRELHRYLVLIGGLSSDGLLLVIISEFTSRSTVQSWHLENHPYLSLFFIVLPTSVAASIIVSLRKKLTNKKAITFLSFEALCVLSVTADILISGIRLSYITVAFSLLLIYINVQIDYEKMKEQQLTRQRVSIMFSQIQPHFLYNVLASIKSLCRINPPLAEQALVNFTAFLRSNLNALTTEGEVPFLQELEQTHHYLELEKMRFGEDLNIEIDTPVTEFSLPPLTLEPIVENAVRHGVMSREVGGTVTIRTAETKRAFVILVSDDGVGFDPKKLAEHYEGHVGLMNVKERLRAFDNGELSVSSVLEQGTMVTITIPKQQRRPEPSA
ncbi:MAG: histidine kinase [Lawsonibacter sp.]|nr:histidine kinase [Lawsonibacter sp.]